MAVADYIVSGAGGMHYRDLADRSSLRPSTADSRFVHQDNGFVWFNAERTRVQVRFYDTSGHVIYRFTKQK